MRLPYRHSTIFCSALLLSSLLACSDDGGSEVGDEAETGTSGDASTGDTEGESSDSGSTDDAETSVSETSDAESSDADTTDAESTDADTSETKGTEETGETGNVECEAIETLEDCQAAAGCQPVEGQPLVGGGLGSAPCLDPSEFLGCIPTQGCDDALTWFCMGDASYLVSNGCGPAGFDMCQGPPNTPMDCK